MIRNYNALIKFDTHQLEKGNILAEVGGTIYAYGPGFSRDGFSHYFEIVEIVNNTEYRVKNLNKKGLDTVTERTYLGIPVLIYGKKTGEYSSHENYIPEYATLARQITIIE